MGVRRSFGVMQPRRKKPRPVEVNRSRPRAVRHYRRDRAGTAGRRAPRSECRGVARAGVDRSCGGALGGVVAGTAPGGALSEVPAARGMATLKKHSGRNGQVGRRPRATLLLRLAGRITAAAVALLVFTLVGVQFARVIGENVAMASELSGVNNDISALQARIACSCANCAACAIRRVPSRRSTTGCGSSARTKRSSSSAPPRPQRLSGIGVARARHQPQRLRRDGPARERRTGDCARERRRGPSADYQRSLVRRKELAFEVRHEGRRTTVLLAPQIRDDELDERIAEYLKSTQEWEDPEVRPLTSGTSSVRSDARPSLPRSTRTVEQALRGHLHRNQLDARPVGRRRA